MALDNNNISFIGNGTFVGLVNLKFLQLHGNPLQMICSYAFDGLSSLQSLMLRDMTITHITETAFHGLVSLTHLDLSNNVEMTMHNLMFQNQTILKYLNVKGLEVNLRMVTVIPLLGNMAYIGSNDWQFCCLAKSVIHCDSGTETISTCEDLLGTLALKISVWAPAFCGLVGNGIVLIYRGLYLKSWNHYNLIITSLAVSDIATAFYLTGLGTADVIFQDRYMLEEEMWTQSAFCKALGYTSSLSTQMSLVTVVYLSYFHWYVTKSIGVVRPIGPVKTMFFILGLWVFNGLLCALPLTGISEIESGLCMYLNLGHKDYKGWVYNLILHCFVNITLTMAPLVSCVLIIYTIYQSNTSVRKTGHVFGKQKKVSQYIWLIAFVLSNQLCLIPIEILMVLSLLGFKFSGNVAGWFTILILPLNSITNPFLYTIRNMKKT